VLRIWPTYAVGLTITALMVIGCAAWFGQPRPFAWPTYFLQLLFVQDMFGVISIDGIVWTLEIEVRFYILMAFMAGAVSLGRIWPLAVAAAALTCFTIASSRLPDWLISGEPFYRTLYALTLSAQMLCYM